MSMPSEILLSRVLYQPAQGYCWGSRLRSNMVLWRDLGVSSWPTLVVVSPRGRVLASLAGARPPAHVAVPVHRRMHKLRVPCGDVPAAHHGALPALHQAQPGSSTLQSPSSTLVLQAQL